ncbi:PAS domain-containing hybrid sensor histidine kinase/response regulator [Deminuibacter soli]|uniref:histidine kinase n=1 Tax=Deminuibacter soli TaxID=2291815 RepID=A0A3E1NQN0_9BACT|nr:PAS domain-containing hybrid sensor histidine kinase/response regulator [Deminuibacter soli]RFM30269.1 PAS domain S-box protein [Deminuibacter soli]
MKSIFTIFRKKIPVSAVPVKDQRQLFDFLIREISVPKRAEELIAVGKRDRSSAADELLPDYFLFERYLTNLDPEQKHTRKSLRTAIQQKFPELASDPFLSILFISDIEKRQRLSVFFVQQCLTICGNSFGTSNKFLEQLSLHLAASQRQDASEQNLQDLQGLTDSLYNYVTTNFGQGLAERIYNNAYQETARFYRQLEVFPHLISILPKSIVGLAQLNILTQSQVEQIYLEKQKETEGLNIQLKQKIEEAEEARNLALKNEILLSSVIASSLDAMVSLDEHGSIIHWNRAAVEIFGYQPEEAIGQKLSDIIVPPNQAAAHKHGFERFLRTRESSIMNRRLELSAMRKNGDIFPVEIVITMAEHKDGLYFNGFIRDISERKEKENELIQTRLQAELAAKAKTDFLSVMSHEIRTPLHAIIGFSHLLLENRPRADQQEFLNMLKFSGETLLHIINDILDFNKLESGKLELDTEEFNLKDLLDNIYKTFLPKAKENGIQLQLLFDQRLPAHVKADPGRISQVINNLVSNAIKFTPKGSVKIIVTLESEENNDCMVEFAVKDTGIGIAYDKQQKIFDLFTQADSNTTRKYGGTGLGLSIAKKLLQLMKSDIKLESDTWNGSKFYFSVRLQKAGGVAESPDDAMQSEGRYNRHAFDGKKILLAEDNEINVMVARQFVADWGGLVVVANNGIEAVDLFTTDTFDLVLMDLQMPQMDGFTSSREIRKHNSHVPIVALTASPIDEVIGNIMSSGMNDYISKPFVPDMLYSKLSKYLLQAAPVQ